MAGRFDGLRDMEWQLLADMFPPAPPRRSRATAPFPPGKGGGEGIA
jgi:hypothetical protein